MFVQQRCFTTPKVDPNVVNKGKPKPKVGFLELTFCVAGFSFAMVMGVVQVVSER